MFQLPNVEQLGWVNNSIIFLTLIQTSFVWVSLKLWCLKGNFKSTEAQTPVCHDNYCVLILILKLEASLGDLMKICSENGMSSTTQ